MCVGQEFSFEHLNLIPKRHPNENVYTPFVDYLGLKFGGILKTSILELKEYRSLKLKKGSGRKYFFWKMSRLRRK